MLVIYSLIKIFQAMYFQLWYNNIYPHPQFFFTELLIF